MINHSLLGQIQYVYYWMDGTWCYQDELSQFVHKSDDYQTLTLGPVDDDVIEQIVLELCNGNT
jgi:hypothetical protein